MPTPAVKVERVSIAADLLVCSAEPEALPDKPWPVNEEVIAWAEAVKLAGRDCRAKLEEVRKLQGAP